MEKEFVSYEIASALKELGFEEPCIALYKFKKFKYNIKDCNELVIFYNRDGNVISYLAPLYQQAFRWFREKYKLQCYPILDTEGIYLCLFSDGIGSGYLLKNGDYGHWSDEHLEFNTYEEAELECLKKLIEIVKEQK
jgi:hypothetical protein